MEIKVCPKIVGIEGKYFQSVFRLENAEDVSFNIIKLPENIQYESFSRTGLNLTVCWKANSTGRGEVTLEIDGQIFEVPFVVFRQTEFFLCPVISSNFHYGYDPSTYNDVWHGKHKYVCGHGFFKAEKELLPIFHKHNIPVTWLIDPIVAFAARDKIDGWHHQYGDDYGVMPTSRFFWNDENFNVVKSYEETEKMLKDAVGYVTGNFGYYTEIAGFDTWMGGVGSNFIKASESMEMKGVWGICFDHRTCDTSVYHRGTPWDVYKPDASDYRTPSRKPSTMWAFQWTTRDIINTVHSPGGASGSVIFSTDPDDTRQHQIMRHQRDYYNKMLTEYKNNKKTNEFFVFVMHQEDHDSHYQEDNAYYEEFFDSLLPDDEVTPATLQEVTAWLNLKYQPEDHPQQALYLQDTLKCKEQVDWMNIPKPDDWGAYPPHIAAYDNTMQVVFQKPDKQPFRMFDYLEEQPFDEEGEFLEKKLRDISVEQEKLVFINGHLHYQARINSEEACKRYPIAVWDLPKEIAISLIDYDLLHTQTCMIITLDLKKGINEICIPLKRKLKTEIAVQGDCHADKI